MEEFNIRIFYDLHTDGLEPDKWDEIGIADVDFFLKNHHYFFLKNQKSKFKSKHEIRYDFDYFFKIILNLNTKFHVFLQVSNVFTGIAGHTCSGWPSAERRKSVGEKFFFESDFQNFVSNSCKSSRNSPFSIKFRQQS